MGFAPTVSAILGCPLGPKWSRVPATLLRILHEPTSFALARVDSCRNIVSDLRLFAVAADEPALTKEQIKQFLVTAKGVKSRKAPKGITHTHRLPLSDGPVSHE